MKTTTIQELLSSSEDFNLEAFRADIKKVYEAKEGVSANGNWRLQPCLVSDGKNDIRVVFSGRNAFSPSDLEGKELFAQAYKSKAGNISGIKLKVSEWKGKEKKEVFIYEAARLSFGDEDAGTATFASDNESERKIVKEGSIKQSTDEFEEFSKSEDNIQGAKQDLAKSANLMLLCLDASRFVKTEYEGKHGSQMTDDQFQAITSSLFINADKRGLISKMPSTKMEE